MNYKNAEQIIVIINAIITVPCIYFFITLANPIFAAVNMACFWKTYYGLKKYMRRVDSGEYQPSFWLFIQHILYRFY
jgi:hypothetical protein